MNDEDNINKNIEDEGIKKHYEINSPFNQSLNKSPIPMIAGILLIIAGILAFLFWIQFFTIDVATLESLIDISQFEQINPSISSEQIVEFLNTCAIIGCIIVVFTILGGILSLKRKLWGIALACSIIGLFSLGILLFSSVLSLIAMILLIISRKEFEKKPLI